MTETKTHAHAPRRHWRPLVAGPTLEALGTNDRRVLVETGIGAAVDECDQCVISAAEQLATDPRAMICARRYAAVAAGAVDRLTEAGTVDETLEVAEIERDIPDPNDRAIAMRLILLTVKSAMQDLHDEHCDCTTEREHTGPPRVDRPGQRQRGR